MWICRWVYPGVWESSGQWVFKSGSVSVLCPAVGLSRCLGVWVWGIQMSGYLSAGYLCTNTLVFESGHRLSCARGVCVFRCVYLQERGVHLLDGKCPGDCAQLWTRAVPAQLVTPPSLGLASQSPCRPQGREPQKEAPGALLPYGESV